MRLSRVHVDAELRAGMRITVEGSAGNHVARVLRLRAGDALTVFDGRGGEYAGSIEQIRRDSVVVNVGDHRDVERESSVHITLAQGISRAERMDWVVQKATELGVTGILPLFTERSVVQLDERQASRKLAHWRAIAIAACEQSGRNRIPAIHTPMGLPAFLERPAPSGVMLLLAPEAAVRIAEIRGQVGEVTVLIGPEGGLSEFEREAAVRRRFTPVRMGPRILRTETAAVCALSLLQQTFGDL